MPLSLPQQKPKIRFKQLNLVHTTLLSNISNILRHEKVSPKFCSVFNKNLLYCFYGKASYRSKRGKNQISSIEDFFPIAIFFKYPSRRQQKEMVENIYPFDSGAFKNNVYVPPFSINENIDDYSLGREIAAADVFLNTFFDNYREYYCGNVKKIETSNTSNSLLKCYNLYATTGIVSFDDRAKTVEIILNKELSLSRKSIDLIICPESLRRSFEKTKLANKVIYYETKKLGQAEDYYAVINQFTVDKIIKKKQCFLKRK